MLLSGLSQALRQSGSNVRSLRMLAASRQHLVNIGTTAAETFHTGQSEALLRSQDLSSRRHYSTDCSLPKRVPPRVRFKKKKYCPECGKNVAPEEVDDMKEACGVMWRKYMRLDDRHCPLWGACEVKSVEGHDEEPSLWEPMPKLKGRS
eukprot:TRINITY_DN5624_c2_g1_i1.p1 TRINITY_DN5624_c2_g1~~TRINITY_DN5624_c2_g1_i1.p1  ORF type:complete len:149 (-),score=20.98 TRINITY_DN5624_c2_g1_i1:81-527(-)